METAAIDALLRDVAAFGLTDDCDLMADLDGEDWTRFLELARAHRLSGLLSEAVRTSSFPLAESRRAEVRDIHRQMAARVLLLEATLVTVAGLLDTAGISFRVLKGPAAAALYPNPIWRPYVDIDVLVPGEGFADAARILDGMGYKRRNAGLGERFDRQFGKGATFGHETTGVNVDLHRTLVAGPYGFLIEAADLFAHSAPVNVAGASLPALDLEARFVHSCVSTVLSDARPKLITIRDVAEQFRSVELDTARVSDLCERWRIGGVVATAMAMTEEALGTREGHLHRFGDRRPRLTERIGRWAYTGDHKRWRRQAITATPFVPGWSNRMSYLRSIVSARGADER